jgi:beta-phosphoglucomutase
MIKAVIFDFDGTVIDNMHYHYVTFKKVIGDRMKLEPMDIYKREGGNLFEIVADITRELDLDEHEIRSLLEEKKKEYLAAAGNLKLRPEALKLVRKLRTLNYKTGLATGSHRRTLDIHMTPREFGLFDFIVTGDDIKNPKPHPEPYLKCAEGLGARPEECVVVENAPLGVESAKSAGMICIAFTSTLTPEYLKRADFVVDSLKEVEDIINKL